MDALGDEGESAMIISEWLSSRLGSEKPGLIAGDWG